MLDQVNAPSAVVSPDGAAEGAFEVVDDALGAAEGAGDVDADDDFVATVGVLEVHRVEGRDRLDFAGGDLQDAGDLGHRVRRDQPALVLHRPQRWEDRAAREWIAIAGMLDGGPRLRLQGHARGPRNRRGLA